MNATQLKPHEIPAAADAARNQSDPVVILARQRRAEIASALVAVRRKNRIAVVGLCVSLMSVFISVGFLWWWKAKESGDAYGLTLQSPIELRSPFKITKNSDGQNNNGPSNSPPTNGSNGTKAPSGDSVTK
jgi:hypothetical protein